VGAAIAKQVSAADHYWLHDLRHTSASLMLNHDIPVIIVSHRLGHARASITSDVYGHLLPNMQDEAAEMIDDLVTPTEVKLDEPISAV
jgi:integrase